MLPDEARFIASQRQQAWIRIVLSVVFGLWLMAHAPDFHRFAPLVLGSVALQGALNLFGVLLWIPRAPRSAARLLLTAMFDFYMIGMAMTVDGGHASLLYFLLLSPIIGNGLRYGQRMLIFSRVMALLTLAITAAITPLIGHAIDWPGLFAEFFALLYISGYGLVILKKAEKTLRQWQQAENLARRILLDSPNPAFIFEPDARHRPIITRVSPSIGTMSAIPPEELIGQPATLLFIEEDAPLLIEACRNLAAQPGSIRRLYLRARDTRGKPIQLMAEISMLDGDERPTGICHLTDISQTERLQRELAEAQKMGYTAALAAGIAHDFRNILAGIIGQAELITMDSKDPAAREGATHIIEAGERGAEMVGQLLQVARSDQSERRAIDLARELDEMLQIARVQLPPDIRLKVRLEKGLPPIRANLAQLEQILLNLINNAAHAMPDGKGEIQVTLSGDGPDRIALEVRDNGRGIPAEHLPHIFKPFWSTRKTSGGTGLGLAMVQRLVRWHQGQIEVHSEAGAGTSFIIRLPAAGANDKTRADAAISARNENADDSAPPEPLLPWKVLLVEDDAEVARVHRACLEQLGLKVIMAENGRAAADLLQREGDTIDMVCSDYMMPEMDGVQLAQFVRERHPSMPMLIITAFGENAELGMLRDLGVTVLSKPAPIRLLGRTILRLQREAADRC